MEHSSQSPLEENPFIPAHDDDDSNVLPTSNLPIPKLPGTTTPRSSQSRSPQWLQRPHFQAFQLPMRRTVEGGKVAIPRQPTTSTPRYSRRVPRACESCRQRKTKCSGDTPVCRQCMELRISCSYPVSWRERTNQYVAAFFVFGFFCLGLRWCVLVCAGLGLGLGVWADICRGIQTYRWFGCQSARV